ncbi:MAG: molybdenum cofactor biosynthesis protein MoaE [Propionicimonas sp.]
MIGIRLAEVTATPINQADLLALVSRPEAGAVNMFLGVVRDHDRQAAGEVVSLHYTCHPSAPERMGQIVQAVLSDSDPDGQCAVAAAHRIGHLAVGDYAFVVAVSAPHRQLAFSVCERVVERVKHQLPIWKQQFEADGSYRWSGL